MSTPTMRLDRLFGQTLRQAPADADTDGHRLLLRAAFIRQLGSGIYTAMPLGWRSLQRVMTIIRAEMNGIGGQELSMPVVHPAELWQRTGRYDTVDVMARFKDRGGRDLVLGPTHEEVVTDLAAPRSSPGGNCPSSCIRFKPSSVTSRGREPDSSASANSS